MNKKNGGVADAVASQLFQRSNLFGRECQYFICELNLLYTENNSAMGRKKKGLRYIFLLTKTEKYGEKFDILRVLKH